LQTERADAAALDHAACRNPTAARPHRRARIADADAGKIGDAAAGKNDALIGIQRTEIINLPVEARFGDEFAVAENIAIVAVGEAKRVVGQFVELSIAVRRAENEREAGPAVDPVRILTLWMPMAGRPLA
jgi:hypothetical protein